ncbi:MAG: 4-alpha-glucanotransferase [Candidatus Omnitrophica bacterium]|nr:4-alpha-glucanotransferase [Candidatus Omnitrophota bacterium]
MDKRGSGVLLHITSLPSPYGIGDFGKGAYRFVDFLYETKQSYWQILPINPTMEIYGNSPYSSISAFSGNPLFISPEILWENSLLSKSIIKDIPKFSSTKCDYSKVIPYKEKILINSYLCFKKLKSKQEYEEFCGNNSFWLDDYVLFVIIKKIMGGKIWSEWDRELKDRDTSALEKIKKKYKDDIDKVKFSQYIFYKQWSLLKKYCNEKGIKIIGDIPIYVSYDSADVWANPQNFKLDSDKKPIFVAGVPPDYFSKTGQLWGNPVYHWDNLKKENFSWWLLRLEHNLRLFDIIRIDHFRGLVAYWEVPAEEKTAVNGKWVSVPVNDFFEAIYQKFPHMPFIAEDLGVITPDVEEIRVRFKLAGMKILLFAFGENNPKHPYLIHNYDKNYVVYTGTHDNNTARGWFEHEAKDEEKKRLFLYLGRKVSSEEVSWELIRLAMISVADTVIFPMQDILGLGEEARMNIPSTTQGNWQWRLTEKQLSSSLTEKLLEMTEIYGRANR